MTRKEAHLGIKLIGQELTVLSIDDILLSVHEPVGNLELGWVLNDGDNTFEFIGIEFSRSVMTRTITLVT